jgi:plastocyanin
MIHAHARRLTLIAAPLVILALPTAGLASAAAAMSVGNGTTINDHGTQDVSGATSVSMQMGDMFFAPSTLKGRPGQRVTINLTNTGQASHTFTLAAQNIDRLVAPGAHASVTVAFPVSGSTVWMCKFHTAMGMNGALQLVSAASPTPVPTPAATTTGTGAGAGTSTSSRNSTRTSQASTNATTSGNASPALTTPAGGVSTGAGGTAGKANLALLVSGTLVAVAGAALLTRRRAFGRRS